MLLRRHYDRISLLCRRLCGNEADALDATQEAMITIARRLHRFDGRSAFSTWAYRVATNACLDELRRRRRRPEPLDMSTPEHDHRGPVSDDPTNPVAERDEVLAALAALPAEFRAAVVLRDVLDLEYAHIAEILDIPVGTVRSRIARGRAHLARLLAGNRTGATARPSTVTRATIEAPSSQDPSSQEPAPS